MVRCAQCGAESPDGARFCSGCGARLDPWLPAGPPPPGAGPPQRPPAPLPTEPLPPPQPGLVCPNCGNRTVPVAYFSRGVNVAKAVALFPFTNVVGPLVFFFLRKDRFICTVCRGILPVEAPVRFLEAFSADTTLLPPPDLTPTGAAGLDGDAPVIERRSRTSQVRAWFYGFVSLGSLGVAMVDQEAAFAIVSAASGAFSIRSALRSTKLGQLAAARRHQQRTVRLLDLARDRGGRLTVTDVAGHFRIGFQEAEQVLDSVVDGRRVDMVVDPEGQVTYVFPELSRGLPAGPGRAG